MKTTLSAGLALAGISLLAASGAQASPGDVVFKGAAVIRSTSGCTAGWNPVNQYFTMTYWRPIAGSQNGNQSTIVFHDNLSGEGFAANGVFGTAYKTVTATHIYTLTGTYTAQLRLASASPVTPTLATQAVTLTGTVKGWDRRPNCYVNFSASLLRDPNP